MTAKSVETPCLDSVYYVKGCTVCVNVYLVLDNKKTYVCKVKSFATLISLFCISFEREKVEIFFPAIFEYLRDPLCFMLEA